MALFPEQDAESAARQAEIFWRVPIGAASPLWAAYTTMASAGVAYWWMSQWTRPMNLEAFAWRMPALPQMMTTTGMMAETLAAVQPEPAAPPAEPAIEPDAPEAMIASAGAEAAGAAAEAVGEAAMAASMTADDLTRLVGIGPSLATKLADLGVRTFADIAAWTEDDLNEMDRTLDLKGRAARDRWVEQARQFAQQ